MITADQLRAELSYDPETGVFRRAVARGGQDVGVEAGWLNARGYVDINVAGKRYPAHRLAWLYVYGEWPKQTIDHINQQPTDNRLCNLRDVSQGENNRNRGLMRNNTSGVKGVYWHKVSEAWMVCAHVNKRTKALGYFSDWFDAVCARKSWEASYAV